MKLVFESNRPYSESSQEGCLVMRILKFLGIMTLLMGLSSAAQASTLAFDLSTDPSGSGLLASGKGALTDNTLTLSSMPSYSRLVLTFTFIPAAIGASVSTDYNGNIAGVSYMGPSTPYAFKNTTLDHGVTGTLEVSSSGAALTVKNMTHDLYTFQNMLAVYFRNCTEGVVNYSYTLTAIPLPAVLPLFAVGVLGLGAAKKRRKA